LCLSVMVLPCGLSVHGCGLVGISCGVWISQHTPWLVGSRRSFEHFRFGRDDGTGAASVWALRPRMCSSCRLFQLWKGSCGVWISHTPWLVCFHRVQWFRRDVGMGHSLPATDWWAKATALPLLALHSFDNVLEHTHVQAPLCRLVVRLLSVSTGPIGLVLAALSKE
jgi:hypothetical protein